MLRGPAYTALAFTAVLTAQAAPREGAAIQAPAEPFASVWYRGGPDGAPRQDDLVALRAYGFAAVNWPAEAPEHIDEVRRLAAGLGLHVLVESAEPVLTPRSALRPTHAVRVPTGGAPGPAALAWRALLHGARILAFDAGAPTGAGLTDAAGQPSAWIRDAADVSRHLAFNGRILLDLVPGPDVIVVPPRPAGLDIVLQQTPRLWLLAATNTSAEPAHAVAQLPSGVPPALWVDLLDGTEMSMLNRQIGPQWTFDLAPGAARLYAIDKPRR
jgi:hypothetical protein